MTKEKLDGPEIPGPPVDQSRFGTPHGRGAVGGRVEPNRPHPRPDDPGILPGRKMGRFRQPTRKQRATEPSESTRQPMGETGNPAPTHSLVGRASQRKPRAASPTGCQGRARIKEFSLGASSSSNPTASFASFSSAGWPMLEIRPSSWPKNHAMRSYRPGSKRRAIRHHGTNAAPLAAKGPFAYHRSGKPDVGNNGGNERRETHR
jgi:hypothetical protein